MHRCSILMLLNIAKVFICTGVSKYSSKNTVILNLVYIHRDRSVAASQPNLSPLTSKLHDFTSPIAEGDEHDMINADAPPQNDVTVESPGSEQVAVVVKQPSVTVR